MPSLDHEPPGLTELAGRLAHTSLGALKNRGELLVVEWQEEKARLTDLMMWGAAMVFFAVMVMITLTALIVFLFPEDLRLYAAGGFVLLYGIGAVVAFVTVRGLLRHEPFAESLEQVKKDRLCLESLK